MRFDRPDGVAEATDKEKGKDDYAVKSFHGAGEADGAGEAEESEEEEEPLPSNELPDELGLEGGAVVESGSKEAAGGSDVSVSGGGNGAEPEEPLPAGDGFVEPPLACCFFFSAAREASSRNGIRAFSPTFALSWPILFLASSHSLEPGC